MSPVPTVPGYQVDDRSSGDGSVWRARDLSDGAMVAVKFVPGGADQALRLRSEVAAQAAIAGPHVLPVRDVVVRGGDAVVVTEWAPGGSLLGLLAARGRLGAGEIVTVLVPLAEVLDRCHHRLLVHGDVAPGNVLFAADGRPMLADFGLARALAGSDESGPVSASPGYVDPAVAAGGRPDAAADVFGLAALGYAALTGRPPWVGTDPAAVLAAARRGRRPSVDVLAPSAPPAMRTAIEAGLSRDPADRPTAPEFAAFLAEACDPAPVQLRSSVGRSRSEQQTVVLAVPGRDIGDLTPAEKPRWWPPPRIARLAGAATLAVALAVAAGIWWGRAGEGGAAVAPRLAAAPMAGTAAPSHQPDKPDSTAMGDASAGTGKPAARRQSQQIWVQRLDRFDRLRTRALRTGNAALLEQVYAQGSPALRADAATLRHLAVRGLTARGFDSRIADVRLQQASRTRAVVSLTSTVSSYQLVAVTTGAVVSAMPPTPREAARVVLVRPDPRGPWRIQRLSPA